MKILLLLITLTLALMKEEKKPGYIKFVSLGTTRVCTDYAFKFNIIAGSIEIEEGTGFTLKLEKPNYASASCEIEEDEIICSINIEIYPLDNFDITLPSDISSMLDYDYEGWENVQREVRKEQYCMPKYIGKIKPNNKTTCKNDTNFKELNVQGILTMDIPKDLKSKYNLNCSYLKDESVYKKEFEDCTLNITNKINSTYANVEMIYKLKANYKVKFYPTIATNIENEDFYIKSFDEYNLTKVCKGKMPFLNKYLFIFILFLF